MLKQMENLLNKFTENYLNKLEVGYRLPPEVKLEEFWESLINFRKQKAELTPLTDQNGDNFWYAVPHSLQKLLHEIDSYGRDSLYSMVKKEIESEIIKESLIEEAFYSSVIEGAFSTLKKAKELAAEKEKPKDNSEQMILNNYYAMRYILENKDKKFSNELILELHKIVTDNTLEEKDHAGKYRDDMVYITDAQGKTIYTPPAAEKIPEEMQKLIDWVNQGNKEEFIHPIVKASILHFYFVYLHPFFDGNGRTSRALFYFYLIKNQYEFFKYFSISSMINTSRSKYYESIKEAEDYNADLTYFLIYMAESISKAIDEVTAKLTEHYRKDYFLSKIKEKKIPLNRRQDKFIKKILLWKEKQIDIIKYKELYEIVYQTSRADLLDLANKNILIKQKKGKKFIFSLNLNF